MSRLQYRLFPQHDPTVVRTALAVTAPATTAGNRRMTIRLDKTTDVTARVLRHVTAVAGDTVAVVRDRHTLVVIGAVGPASSPPAPPPDPPNPETDPDVDEKPPTSTTTTVTLTPSTTGTARDGSWRPDTDSLYCGDWTGRGINRGAAFYPRARKLSGTVIRARLNNVERRTGGIFSALTVPLALIRQSSPAGTLTVDATRNGPTLAVGQTAQNVTIPTSWAQDLVDGNAGAIGISSGANASPYIALAGRSSRGNALTLTLTIRR